ncbi:MAG: hypothetical protein Tsb009_29390 [Planctomycetaceae bacterium]
MNTNAEMPTQCTEMNWEMRAFTCMFEETAQPVSERFSKTDSEGIEDYPSATGGIGAILT